MHHRLFVLAPPASQAGFGSQFVQRLAQPGDVAVAEYRPDSGDEPPAHAIAHRVLRGHEPDERLSDGQADGCHDVTSREPGTVSRFPDGEIRCFRIPKPPAASGPGTTPRTR